MKRDEMEETGGHTGVHTHAFVCGDGEKREEDEDQPLVSLTHSPQQQSLCPHTPHAVPGGWGSMNEKDAVVVVSASSIHTMEL